MSHHERKQRAERAVFDRFCIAAKLAVTAGSLIQPAPPAPDILAHLEDLGDQGFELVALQDKNSLRRHRLMPDSSDLVHQYYDSQIFREQRVEFDKKYRGAMFSIYFDSSRGGARGVRNAIPRLFTALLALPADIEGEVLEDYRTRVDGVEYVYIGREVSDDGPEFSTASAGRVLPLDLSQFQIKMREKSYVCNAPLNLLAYAPEVSHVRDVEVLPPLIKSLLPESQFSCVWIFEDFLGKVAAYRR